MAVITRLVTLYQEDAVPRLGREWCALQGSYANWGGDRIVDGAVNPRTSWHLRQIGLEDELGTRSWPMLSGPAIPQTRLVLLDTEVPAVGSTLGSLVDVVESSSIAPFLSEPPDRSIEHTHGAAMAVLARTVAGPIRIENLAVLDHNGYGSLSSVARGLDAALFDLPDPVNYRPLVLNLSLGFPPELEAGVELDCPTPVRQDGIAEPLRYLLRVARKLDSPSTPFLPIAAS